MLPIALGILAVAGLIAAVWFWDRMTGDRASDSARGTEARVYAGWANGTRPAREHAELAITWGQPVVASSSTLGTPSVFSPDDNCVLVTHRHSSILLGSGISEEGELLRFNRGNCLMRLDRPSDAVVDYEHCLELAPEWTDPRVNAVSAYCLLGDADKACSHLAALAEMPGVDPDLLDELRQQVDAATDP